MERRPASHTEEEEMNQRRRLLNLARKGDLKAINRLFELYQVRVYSGDNLKKVGKTPFAPPAQPSGKGNARARRRAATARRRFAARKRVTKATRKKPTRKTARKTVRKPARRSHR